MRQAGNELLQAVDNIDFSASLDKIWLVINQANKFIEETKPWNLLKEDGKQELDSFILVLVYAVRRISQSLSAFMPKACALIQEQFASSRITKASRSFPELKMLVDTHAHLDFSDFDPDRKDILQRSAQAGVKYIINVSSDMRGCLASLELGKEL